jgi:hypothetical protein
MLSTKAVTEYDANTGPQGYVSGDGCQQDRYVMTDAESLENSSVEQALEQIQLFNFRSVRNESAPMSSNLQSSCSDSVNAAELDFVIDCMLIDACRLPNFKLIPDIYDPVRRLRDPLPATPPKVYLKKGTDLMV